uniref:Mitochondrial ribosomal subunit protein, putative n=1 Tax=Theileria annulata TaxID=5874 RepID=A0A3B0N4K2_THEAN
MSLLIKCFFPPSKYYACTGFHLMESNLFVLTQTMGKKKRRKVERVVKTPEQIETSSSNIIRRQDMVGTPETPESISKTIKGQLNLISKGYITRKHIARFRKYKVCLQRFIFKALRELGKTHDSPRSLKSSFVTPLTRLQHESELPKTLNHTRHEFPHTLHYKVDWYGSSTPCPYPPDNRCYVSFNFKDLNLSYKQLEGLKEILGPKRYDLKSGICVLESDLFDNLNQNASYLGKYIVCINFRRHY